MFPTDAVELVRFTPTQSGRVKHQAGNVVHIVKERGEEIRTLCGVKAHWTREMGRDHDYESRMCGQCLLSKDKADRGA